MGASVISYARWYYWELPPRLLDDADELAQWAQQAYAIACAAKAKTSRKKKSAKRKR